MAERKTGPVKPPVIDLTARPAEAAKPAAAPKPAEAAKPADTARPVEPPKAAESAKPADTAKAADIAKPAEAPRPPPDRATAPKPPPPAPSPWPAASTGALVGAIIAVAACYGLATFGYWPANGSTDSRFAALENRLADAEKANGVGTTALADVNTRLGGLESNFAARLAAADSTLGQMQQNLTQLQSAKPQSPDLAPLEAQLKTLAARVDAVAAGASSADAGALAANLATVQQNLGDLSGKLAALDGRAGQTDATIAGLKTELDSAKGAIDQAAAAPTPKAIASAMQLPLLISALDTDFAGGRPYAADLAALTAAMPEAKVPAAVTEAAATGLPSPDDLSRTFEAHMPDMLAARPAGTDSSWQAETMDWLKNALALRPVGEQQGDGPDAILSRVEGAIGRHDFAVAAKLLDQLPAPMKAAAGDSVAKLKALADAQTFVAGLRTDALAPVAGAQQ